MEAIFTSKCLFLDLKSRYSQFSSNKDSYISQEATLERCSAGLGEARLLKEVGMEAWTFARRELTSGFKMVLTNASGHVLTRDQEMQTCYYIPIDEGEDDATTTFDISQGKTSILKGRSLGIFRTVYAALGYQVIMESRFDF